jgi:hypothetical protein
MGAIGGMLGVNGGAGGTGFSGPQSASITNPTTAGQISGAYTGAQNSMNSQQQLLQALQGQNGLGNQSQVYNQLQGVANGTGPNPAQAMLNQSTGENVANQAALMAGQRGASSNVGLMARQAAQQGANTQQQAVGQAATMQANQSLNAINSAGAMANAQAGNQINQANTNTASQQAEQQALLNAQQGVNSSNVSNQASINSANAGLAGSEMGMAGSAIGGAASGAAMAMAGPAAMANGGSVMDTVSAGGLTTDPNQPSSAFGKFLKNMRPQNSPDASMQQGMTALSGAIATHMKSNPNTPAPASTTTGGDMIGSGDMAAKGGTVKALVSPGEKYLPPKAVAAVEKGANPMKVGETIKGKPKVGGAVNSYANDTVKKNLKEGGVIVPRSETQSKDPSNASAKFVAAVLAKRKMGK